MDIHNTLGLVAGSLTTLAFVPQVVKIWRTRSADDISTIMFLLFSTGVLLWLLYGIALNAPPIIVANGVTLVLALLVLVLKFRFRR
jgi:MtN3 and saliva related transmembrane protein